MGERRHRIGRRSRDTSRIASERMAVLFRLAQERASAGNQDIAERYISLARAIGMRYNVRVPRAMKRLFCRRCGAFLTPGRNMRVRLRTGKIVNTCLRCGRATRRPTAEKRRR
ncbi:MAG: ribonuclease P protein component 4 [Thermoplasmatota archaeon]